MHLFAEDNYRTEFPKISLNNHAKDEEKHNKVLFAAKIIERTLETSGRRGIKFIMF